MVSVIIPNYNHHKYLDQRISSVFQQSFQNFELILLDDHSEDGSIDILEKYSTHPKLSALLINQQNSGSPFKQWLKGISHAKGEYIWIAESDDYADPKMLESLLEPLQKKPNVGLAYCQSYMVDEGNKIIRDNWRWTESLDTHFWKSDFISSWDKLKPFFIRKNIIPNASAVVFRKSAFERIQPRLDQSFRLLGDWSTWIEMSKEFEVAYINQPLNYFRVSTQSTRVKRNLQKKIQYLGEKLKILSQFEENNAEEKRMIQELRDQLNNEMADHLWANRWQMEPYKSPFLWKKLGLLSSKLITKIVEKSPL
jgi:glycosyltransferase involved in cell wall biosynthesis